MVVTRLAGRYVRHRPLVTVVGAPLGGRVGARMPTPAERAEGKLVEGVPVLVVSDAGGVVSLYPADTTEVSIPLPRRPGYMGDYGLLFVGRVAAPSWGAARPSSYSSMLVSEVGRPSLE
jgi:hypothetical protein